MWPSSRYPYLAIAARYNLAGCYIELKRPHEAHQLFLQAKSINRGAETSLIGLRTSWQEGQLLCMLGRYDASEKAIRFARQGFLDRQLAYEVVVISQDLAHLYAAWGQTEKLEMLGNETVTAVGTLPRPPEAQALLDKLGRMTAR